MYGTIDVFHEHHRIRRGRLVKERLVREPPAVRQAALRLLAPDLTTRGGGTTIVVEL